MALPCVRPTVVAAESNYLSIFSRFGFSHLAVGAETKDADKNVLVGILSEKSLDLLGDLVMSVCT